MKKYCILLLLFFASIIILHAQDYETFIKQAAVQEQQMKEVDALNSYKQALIVKPNDISALLKCSQLYIIIGYKEKEINNIHSYYDTAKEYNEQALKIDSSNIETNYLLALVYNKLSEIETEKKALANDIRNTKTYIDKTIQLNANYAKAWHVLGCWYYNIANLPSLKKTAIKLFYGGMPNASLDQAIECYEKCLVLDPLYLSNYVTLAKAYRDDNQLMKEASLLQKAIKLPIHNSIEMDLKTKAKKRLEELQ